MKNTDWFYRAAVVALAAVCLQAGAATNEWPFAILRCYGSYAANREFIDRVFAAQERHPGLFEEIWFGGSGNLFTEAEKTGEKAAADNLAARERCRRLGIAFSLQICSLNHDPDDVPHPGVPDDAWVVDRTGRRRTGVFCCTSPYALDFNRRRTASVLRALRPDALWPDDDIRNMKGAWDGPFVCFCPRCLDLFGRRLGRRVTREEVVDALRGGKPSPEVRREWCAFCGETLSAYAGTFRRAADEVAPGTRLGQQSCGAFWQLNGDLYPRTLKVFAGKGGRAGLRPGGGYYTDLVQRDQLLGKMLDVNREAMRAARLDVTAQICYEAENWPHVGAIKNAAGMMSECALAMAFGCDSLALYWGADQNGETPESHDYWIETFARWKPFLLDVGRAFRGTFTGGLAMCFGEDVWALPDWHHVGEGDVSRLAVNGLPVTSEFGEPDVWLVNERSVRSLTTNDLRRVFSRAALLDPASLEALGRKFGSLGFVRKVRVEPFSAERALATADRANGYERFRAFGKCEVLKAKIRPVSDDVVTLSGMTADPSTCGTCVIPTEFGGKAVVAQDIHGHWPHPAWPGCRRHGILDAMDLAVPGGMPARLLTDGYATSVSVRKTPDGRTAGVLVMNLGCGETPPLELAIRRGAAKSWTLGLPKRPLSPAVCVRATADETVLRLPSLPAFGVAFVAPAEGRR